MGHSTGPCPLNPAPHLPQTKHIFAFSSTKIYKFVKLFLYMANINEAIFKAYDIRGVYPEDLNEDLVYKIGRAYTTILQNENPGKELSVVVGRDHRLSSPSLSKSLIQGITDQGANVIDIGVVSTPTFYFGVAGGGWR